MIKFLTLGPAGNNHAFVTERYLAFHGLAGRAMVEFIDDFAGGAARVLGGGADFMLQCAVHPETTSTVAQYMRGLFVVDTFISPSRDLAVIRNRHLPEPRSIALMSPTRGYTDLARWGEPIDAATVAAVAEGMASGRFARGLTYASVAEDDPQRFEVEERIGSVDDAWIVYGRERVSGGALLAWPGSPASRIYARLANAQREAS